MMKILTLIFKLAVFSLPACMPCTCMARLHNVLLHVDSEVKDIQFVERYKITKLILDPLFAVSLQQHFEIESPVLLQCLYIFNQATIFEYYILNCYYFYSASLHCCSRCIGQPLLPRLLSHPT